MHRIWPHAEAGPAGDEDLEQLYGYPDDRPWLAVNFVSSADGAVEVQGQSAGLTNATDQRAYRTGSDLADLVLVGAGTANIEDFHGIHPDELMAQRRRRNGLSEVPTLAVVTSGSLPADSPALTDVLTPTVVITCTSTPSATREAWAAAGARVLVAGTDVVDLPLALKSLAGEGLRRVHCDGGPHLFGALLSAGLVDELRMALSPLLVSGGAERIAAGAGIDPAELELASVLAEENTLLLRYLVR